MSWKYDELHPQLQQKVEKYTDGWTRDQLINRLVELETAIHGVAFVLGSINDKSWRGTDIGSQLFPVDVESDDKLREQNEDGKFVLPKSNQFYLSASKVVLLDERDYHKHDYRTHDSLTIQDGTQLGDSFVILEVMKQAPGVDVYCGAITMGDIRFLTNALDPNNKNKDNNANKNNKSTAS